MAEVTVTGLRELTKHLESLGVEVADLKAPFAAVAAKAAQVAAAEAPKRTGRLAASIRGSRTKNRASVAAGSTRVPYAAPVAYGWPKRHIKANDFMKRAADIMAPSAEAEIRTALDKLIRDRGMA